MKKIFLATLLIIVCSSSYSQFENIWKRKPWKNIKFENRHKLSFPTPEPAIVTQPGNNAPQMPVLKLDVSMNLIGKTSKGENLYLIEGYNMPCITPPDTFKSNMPVVGQKPAESSKLGEK